VHLLLCIADHYEPGNGAVSSAQADARVDAWVQRYPELFDEFRDHDGRPPRHTFFYPAEMYRATEMERIAQLCRRGFGEVEIHLHHHDDTPENLRRTLVDYKELLVQRHGLLARRSTTGEVEYGFVHGDWALDNSRPDGHRCGVNNEIDILRETGCYADFTLPSYPSPAQTRKINSIYYAVDDPMSPKSHDWGVDVGTAPAPPSSLMMFQGPLLLNWRNRKFGFLPRVENACIQGNQPPCQRRLDLWLRSRIQIRTRPDWFFVKLHTHGAPEANQKVLLGNGMVEFHRALQRRSQENPDFHYHYVTAREMYNLACAAESGYAGAVDGARDAKLVWDSH
jgi:hypothetical protein